MSGGRVAGSSCEEYRYIGHLDAGIVQRPTFLCGSGNPMISSRGGTNAVRTREKLDNIVSPTYPRPCEKPGSWSLPQRFVRSSRNRDGVSRGTNEQTR